MPVPISRFAFDPAPERPEAVSVRSQAGHERSESALEGEAGVRRHGDLFEEVGLGLRLAVRGRDRGQVGLADPLGLEEV